MLKHQQIHILLIGVGHSIQAKGHIKWHIQKMEKKGFSEELREMMDVHLKSMRNEMLKICEDSNPDLVVEEGGPYINTPADQWKKKIASGKTILEEQYGDKHVFVDAKLPRFLRALREPGRKKREKAFIKGIEECVQNRGGIRNIVFVVGGNHLESVEKMLKEKGFIVESHNINHDLRTDELKQKVKEDAKRITEEKRRIKKKSLLKFWR